MVFPAEEWVRISCLAVYTQPSRVCPFEGTFGVAWLHRADIVSGLELYRTLAMVGGMHAMSSIAARSGARE